MIVRRIAAFTAAVALGVGGFAATASADEVVSGGSAANPIVVKNVSDVPEGAVEDKVSTFDTSAKCDTTRSWVLPGSDAVTHNEQQYLRVVPAVEEVSHQVYAYERQVPRFKTQYQLAKFTRTKVKSADIWQNFSPNKDQGPFEGPPSWPTDDRGTWQHENKPIPPGQQGPDGVYQNGNGNGSWFYRQAGVYGDWGPWTLWEPLSHVSWQDSDAPLGEPAFHAEGKNDDGTSWYREWQARATGETRQIPNGFDTELSGEVLETREGDWTLLEGYPKVVVDQEAVPSYTEYYVVDSEPSLDVEDASWVKNSPGESWSEFNTRVVTDKAAVDPQYYAWTDDAECEVVIVKKPPTKTTVVPVAEVQQLAQTGSNTAPILGWAMAFILAGAAAVIFAARKPSQI